MSSKKKGGGVWQKDEDEIQAVIVADSFNRRFTPITHELPRALLPLGNKVLVDYTIEYLLEQGVQEIIIFCCSLGEKIREHVNAKWSHINKRCHIHCVMSSTTDCISLGDALREIDREGLIRSDFILVPGDLVANVKLSNIMKEHKVKRKKEKNLVMTVLHKVLNPGHFNRCPEEDMVIALETDTNRILHCQKSHACRTISLSTHLLSNRKEISVRYDLNKCYITICSPQVAPLFTDNFDYQTLDDFIKGILINEEILGDQVHASIIEDEYSSRINDLHMYNAVSLDLMKRWIYPLVPESPTCIHRRNNIYLEKDVRIEKDCKITTSVVIGKGCYIAEGTKISKSIIGANCRIGKNVEIKNAYIWDNTVIEDDVSIIQTIVCSNCTLKRSVKLIDSLVSFNVCIGAGMNLPPLTRLSLLKQEDLVDRLDSIDVNETAERTEVYDSAIVGSDGKGFAWPFHDDEDEEVILSLTGNDYDSTSEDSSDEEDELSLPPSPPVELSNLYQFHLEVLENLRCGLTENIAADNIALEINASKFKFNISIPELCETVIRALLELSVKDETRSKQDMVKDLDKVITSFNPLLVKYFNSAESQMYAITAAEGYFVTNLNLGGVLATFLHKMYDKDILDESIILNWYNKPPVAEDFSLQDNYNLLRENQTLVKLMTWLQEAEEEDSDDESD